MPTQSLHMFMAGLKKFREDLLELSCIRIHFMVLPNTLGISVLQNEEMKEVE